MALFKIEKGLANNLTTNRPNANEGYAYFTTDDGKFYIDIAGDGTSSTKANIGVNRIPLNAAAADKLKEKINIKISGEQKGEAAFDGSEDIDINLKSSTFVIGIGTTAGQWIGSLVNSGISELYDGLTIDYWVNIAGTSSSPYTTLNLFLDDGTETGDVNCYYSGTSRLTTHVGINNVIRLVYRENVTIGSTTYTGWWLSYSYDANTVSQLRYQQNIKAQTAITSGYIIGGTTSGYKNITTGASFDITYPILKASAAISASSTGTNNYLAIAFSIASAQKTGTFASYKPVFLKGTLSGTTFTVDSSTVLTQTIPTTEDNKYYMLMGTTYSTTAMFLITEHPIYKFYNGAFRRCVNEFDYYTESEVDEKVEEVTSKAYSTTLSVSGWTKEDDYYIYVYLNTDITCGKSGDLPVLCTYKSNFEDYCKIEHADADAGVGVTFYATEKPDNDIDLIIIDIK